MIQLQCRLQSPPGLPVYLDLISLGMCRPPSNACKHESGRICLFSRQRPHFTQYLLVLYAQ